MIKLIVFDFDGVFTNGKIIFNDQGRRSGFPLLRGVIY